MTRRLVAVWSARVAFVLALAVAVVAALGAAVAPASAPARDVEPGRFVWRDLMTKDVDAAKQFYGELFGWRFEDARRGDRPYVIARRDSMPIAGLVDVSAMPDAGSQWLSFMSVEDVDKSVAFVRAENGTVLVEPRDLPMARAAVISDPQGAPLGLAELRRGAPDPVQPTPHHFFWQEYLAGDVDQALTFYKRLAGYDSVILESRLDVDYHVLRSTRGRAGLFRLPPTVVGVQPNWLPYVLVSDPAALSARVPALGGRVVVAAAPERRNGSLVVIADPGGAVLALQKFPF
ncbi:MAG TPA: VOC family protein [Vicinamibacterales bacterium]|nr:VOC family protein [Vicinamibacterales bacterium]